MIVLTGGAGFIGSCFLRKLNEEGISDVIVVDHLGESYKWKNLNGKKFFDYFHKSDFREKLKKGKFGKDITAIFHFGACSTTTEMDADYVIDNNFSYSKELALFAAKKDIRFIYASSAATYGKGEEGYSDKVFNSLHPLNVYGFSKHLFDLWVIEKKLDKRFTGLKFFNVFGPNEYHKGEMASMIFKAYNQIKETGKVRLFKSNVAEYADGCQMRDFVYVKDTLDVVFRIYKNQDISGIYNLGSGKARNWNDLVNAVFTAMNMKTHIEYVDMPASLKHQYQNYTQADMDKLDTALGGLHFDTLENNISDYVRNHLQKIDIYF